YFWIYMGIHTVNIWKELPGGLVARFTQTMVYRAVPTRAMGRPI
ncbi:unnamed protein product, partial [marine sediment metagenome]